MLSARGKTTDELVEMAHEVSDRPLAREMDMLLSTGERISCALCAMAIHDMGHNAISLTGSQAGIVTDSSHTKARILDVRADRIREALGDDRIVLVAGFQGVSGDSRDVTTLGRGGSDTTAVAIAAALGADVCEIYTDVRGVFSADPRLVPDARLLRVVSFEEMLEMAASGAKVLQLRSVEYARNHGIPIHCRSSFEDGPGTFVVSEKRDDGETLGDSRDPCRRGARDADRRSRRAGRRRAASSAPSPSANVNVDMIIQNEPVSADQKADLSFTVDRGDLRDRDRGARPARDLRAARDRRADRQGLDRRRRDAQPPGRRRQGLPDPGRERDQHRDDLHLADQDLLRDRRRRGPGRRSRRCTRRSSWARTPSAARSRPGRAPAGRPAGRGRRTRPAMAPDGYRVGVLGATGAVGSTMLRVLAERGFPAAEVVAVRLRALGRAQAELRRPRAGMPAALRARRSRASTWSSRRPAAR